MDALDPSWDGLTPGGSMVLGHASCHVRRLLQLPTHLSGRVWQLAHLYVAPEHRRHGAAKRLLEHICRLANASGIVITVEVRPYGDAKMTAEQLQAFYATHGFTAIQAVPLLMARPPAHTNLH